MTSTPTIRLLDATDQAAARELSRLSFGGPAQPSPDVEPPPPPGLTRYGAFDENGRLVGKAVDLHHDQWWGGRPVKAADVGGVAVRPEARGSGVARALLTALLAGARERGAAVSALHPTTSAPYRALGWETAGRYGFQDVPTAALPRRATGARLGLRPGGPDDLAAVTDLYEAAVRHRTGFLSRRGDLFDEPTDTLPEGIDGLTLVEDAGRLVGYASWSRGDGYGGDARLTVLDALAVTPEAGREIAGVLASWASVTPTLRIRPVVGDAVWAHLPVELLRAAPGAWMHRPVDVVRAVEDRGWPAHVSGRVSFRLVDQVAPWNDGSWTFEVSDGRATLRAATTDATATPAAGLTLGARGFALLYCGAATATSLALSGLVTCPSGTDPAVLDLLASGPPAQLLDYF